MPINIESSPKFQVLSAEFRIPLFRQASRLVDIKAAKKKLAESAAGHEVGCYIFAITKGQKFIPWYVGKATKSFAQEVFNSGNIGKYDRALELQRTGKPVVFFIAHPASKGAKNKSAIDYLETTLIVECGSTNPEIMNSHKTTVFQLVIQGIMNTGAGKPSVAARHIMKMMGRNG